MPRRRLGDLLVCVLVLGLIPACFTRLVSEPGALIVDGTDPSVDLVQRVEARPVGNDLTFLFLPNFLKVTNHLSQFGRLPQWDGSGFAGRPMVGNPQTGLFYPPVWLAWLTGAPAALGWLTVVHLAWGGIGVFGLMRGLGVSRVAAFVAAACFEASPYLLAQTFEGHYPHVWAACWYPWAFWAFLEAREGRARGLVALPPTLALMLLAGHPQEWYYLVVALSLWALADAGRAACRGRTQVALAILTAWIATVGLCLGLAAVELLPGLAVQEWALRASRHDLGGLGRYQVHSLNLLQLLSPGALGGPSDYFGHDNYWETVVSVGLVPLVLIVIGVSSPPNREKARGWLVLTVAALIFAGGRRLGVYSLFYELVPGMNRFRVPARSLFLAALGAAVLAGLGADTFASARLSLDDWRRWEWRVRRAAIVVVLGLLIGQGIAWCSSSHPDSSTKPVPMAMAATALPPKHPHGDQYRGCLAAARIVRDGVFWCALLGTLAALACRRSQGASRPALAWGLAALTVLELGLHGHASLKVAPAAGFLGPDPISESLLRARGSRSEPFRVRARDTLYGDLRAIAHGIEKINIYDSFQIQHAADLYRTLYPLLHDYPPPDPDDPMSEVAARHWSAVRQGVLDRWGVAFLVANRVESDPRWPLAVSGTWNGVPYAVHRNPTAMPRAYVVPRAAPAADDAGSVLAKLGEIDPREAVLMPVDPLGSGGRRQPFTKAVWASNDPDRVVLKVTTEAPGLLVVSDTWMPGWTARVDGRPAPVLRGNHAQRVVPLPDPGPHEVVLRYQAPGFVLGTAITQASILVWLIVGGSIWLREVVTGRMRERRGSRAVPSPTGIESRWDGEPAEIGVDGCGK